MTVESSERHAALVEAVGLANPEAPKAPEQQQTPPADVPDPNTANANAEAPQGEEDEDESATSDDNGTPDANRKPRRNKLQERIDKITGEKYSLAARAEAAEALAAQLQQQLQPAPADKPTLESCGYDQDAYEDALVKWARADAAKTVQQEIQQREAARRAQEEAAKVADRIQKLEEKSPGAWEETTTAPINYTPHMVEALRRSEIGPEIGFYLAKHLDEAHAITRLHPVEQVYALGRIEAKLTAPVAAAAPPPPAKPVPKTVTSAPPPPPALQSASKVSVPIEDQSIEDRMKAIREFEARR